MLHTEPVMPGRHRPVVPDSLPSRLFEHNLIFSRAATHPAAGHSGVDADLANVRG
jgi:hypothetical protein